MTLNQDCQPRRRWPGSDSAYDTPRTSAAAAKRPKTAAASRCAASAAGVTERIHSWINRYRGMLARWPKKTGSHTALLQFSLALIA